MTTPEQTMREAMMAWERQAREAAVKASAVDWKKTKVDPKDVGFRMGPMMSEEEFKAHCQRTGVKPTIINKK
jgi:hypothetical protein